MKGLRIGGHVGRRLHLDIGTGDRVLEGLRLGVEQLESGDRGAYSEAGDGDLRGIEILKDLTEGGVGLPPRLGQFTAPFLRGVRQLIELIEVYAESITDARRHLVAGLPEILQLLPRLLGAPGEVSGISLEYCLKVLGCRHVLSWSKNR